MNSNTFPTRKALVLVMALVVSMSVYAQNTMQSGSMPGAVMSGSMGGMSMGANSAGMVVDAFSSFVREWRAAEEALMLSAEQREKLEIVLKATSMKLSDNWAAIENYRKLAASSSGDTQSRYRKRIEIEFAERELIITEIESELLSFLTKDQTNLVLTAAFHGVSPNHSGSMASMPMGGMGGMVAIGEIEMRIGELAAGLNADFRAISVDHIIDTLSSH